MEIQVIDHSFSVCKVADYSKVNWGAEFAFIGKTDEENSLVCLTEDVPSNVIEREDHWQAFRIQGQLDFSLVGILSRITGILAENHMGSLLFQLIIQTISWLRKRILIRQFIPLPTQGIPSSKESEKGRALQ